MTDEDFNRYCVERSFLGPGRDQSRASEAEATPSKELEALVSFYNLEAARTQVAEDVGQQEEKDSLSELEEAINDCVDRALEALRNGHTVVAEALLREVFDKVDNAEEEFLATSALDDVEEALELVEEGSVDEAISLLGRAEIHLMRPVRQTSFGPAN
jgi:hypothetical protein